MREKTTMKINDGDKGRYSTGKCRLCAGFLETDMRPNTECDQSEYLCSP